MNASRLTDVLLARERILARIGNQRTEVAYYGTGLEKPLRLVDNMRDAVLQRGVRADEAAPGSGLGLSIVRDLAEVYGGSISLEASPLGGLRARLRFPA